MRKMCCLATAVSALVLLFSGLASAGEAPAGALQPDRLRPAPQRLSGAPALLQMDLSSGVPTVEARIGETSLRLVVDTGSNWCVISPEAARRAGLQTRSDADLQLRDAAGVRQAVEAARVASLSLPGLDEDSALELHDFDVILLESPSAAGAGADGILGLPLFQRLAARFDFGAGTLHLGRTPLQDGPGVLPLRMAAGRPAVEVRFESLDQPQTLLLDTGLSSPLHLPPALAERVALGDPVLATGQSATAVGQREIELVQLSDDLLIGEHRIHRPTATVLADAGRGGHPAIGCALLRRFVLTLDLPRRRVLLEPAAEAD